MYGYTATPCADSEGTSGQGKEEEVASLYRYTGTS